MHMEGPPRLNYSELHLLSVIGKLSLKIKNPQAFMSSGIPNCSERVGNCDPHSLVASVAAESTSVCSGVGY